MEILDIKKELAGNAYPGRGTRVPLYVLGSSMFGASLAAQLGLPYAFASHFAPQRAKRRHIAARRPAEPEIDAPRVQLGQCAELLGNHEWRVIGKHDAARAQSNGLRVRRDVRDQHRGGARCDRRHVVVLGVPDAPIAAGLGGPRKVD